MSKTDPDENLLMDNLAAVSPGMVEQIVIASKIVLMRNVKDAVFPRKASDEERLRMMGELRAALVPHAFTVTPLTKMPELRRRCLVEDDLLPVEAAEAPLPGTAYAEHDQNAQMTVLLNERDHLAFRCIHKGFALEEAWQSVRAAEQAVDGPLSFAWDEKLGYLTASPGNIGTALRACTVLHLFGLRLTNELEPVLRGLERMRFIVRGYWNNDSIGQVYQIANLDTLGMSEEQIIERVAHVTRIVVRLEYQARLRLLYDQRLLLEDCLFRTLALLSHALLSPEAEAVELLSAVRMMAALKMVKGLSCRQVDEALKNVRSAHFIREGLLPGDADPARFRDDAMLMLDFFRAAYLRKFFEKAQLPEAQ